MGANLGSSATDVSWAQRGPVTCLKLVSPGGKNQVFLTPQDLPLTTVPHSWVSPLTKKPADSGVRHIYTQDISFITGQP